MRRVSFKVAKFWTVLKTAMEETRRSHLGRRAGGREATRDSWRGMR
jgi:hypothetical protein